MSQTSPQKPMSSSKQPISDPFILSDWPAHLNPSTQDRPRVPTLNPRSNIANMFKVNPQMAVQRGSTRLQSYTGYKSKKSTRDRVIQINAFVKKLADHGEEQDVAVVQNKFRALKKIIEFYDIKNLEKEDYSNVIGTFGLQIGQAKSSRKDNRSISSEKKKMFRKRRGEGTVCQSQKRSVIAQKQEYGDRSQRTMNRQAMEKLSFRTLMEEETDKQAKPFFKESKQKKELVSSKFGFATRRSDEVSKIKVFTSLQMRRPRQKDQDSSLKPFKYSSCDVISQKVAKYRQFLFILNFSNNISRPLDIASYEPTLKYFVGRGNNSNLIRSLMRRRFWFEEVSDINSAQFVWTQIKVSKVLSQLQALSIKQNQTQIDKKQRKTKGRANHKVNQSLQRILTSDECKQYAFMQDSLRNRASVTFVDRLKYLPEISSAPICNLLHNHFPANGLLGNKKAMFLSLKAFYDHTGRNIFDIVPITFIISGGISDPEFIRFMNVFKQKKGKNNNWILKPGQFSNRGNGIQCANKIEDIRKRINQCYRIGRGKTSIILQQYISRPLLYHGRKFDLRMYMLLTCVGGTVKGYFYQQGYVRTSSSLFNLDELRDSYVHLTNDAVQQHSDEYGRYEEGNKLSLADLQRYLDTLPALGRKLDYYKVLHPQLKKIAGEAVRATQRWLNPQKYEGCFELYGLDFMIDEDFRPWLIEINTNPCLQLSSQVLHRIIPHVVEHSLRIALDTQFPPPSVIPHSHYYTIPQNALHYNKFELIFDGQQTSGDWKVDGVDGLQEDKMEYKKDGQLLQIGQG